MYVCMCVCMHVDERVGVEEEREERGVVVCVPVPVTVLCCKYCECVSWGTWLSVGRTGEGERRCKGKKTRYSCVIVGGAKHCSGEGKGP